MIDLLFRGRFWTIGFLTLLTAVLLKAALTIIVDAGFEKGLPRQHPYVETFLKYQADFGGANRVLVAVTPKDGDIFDAEFLRTLKAVTNEAYYVDGVNRSQIQSLFTPNVRFIEIVDGGFAGGNVIPADFDFSDEMVKTVKQNVLRSSVIGRLVANDFTSAMVSLQLSEIDPTTRKKVNYLKIADQLESNIRTKHQSDNVDIQIIGFAKAVGDIADGAKNVLLLMLVTVVLVGLMINLFIHSWRLTGLVVLCSMTAVIWNVGLLATLGYGFDPMSILVPFLVFAIGVSHALQIVHRINLGLVDGLSSDEAAREALRVLIFPGLAALSSDTIGFATIYLIAIPIIQELAITASMGVAVLVITNLLLLPLLASLLHFTETDRAKLRKKFASKQWLWAKLGQASCRESSMKALSVAAVVAVIGLAGASQLKIGDLRTGLPELLQDSRYNEDTRVITEKYSIGVDLLTAIVESKENACIDHAIIDHIDTFQWVVSNNPHVQSTLSLPQVMKIVSAGFNEGHPKWRELSRNPQILVQAVTPIETSTGLLNTGCSVMPVLIFLKDHRAESIKSVVATIDQFKVDYPHADVNIRLATGNIGVMAAVNDTVSAAQYPILGWIYGAITLLCLLLFRSVRATLCVVLPLTVVSAFAYALMWWLEIGLKTSSLPIAALGVGIGVDYGIYIFSQLNRRLKAGERLQDAYLKTLEINGSAVLVTGLTLALAVCTWIFSDLQFQRDMGILFSSMLLLNMLGALFVLPALAYVLYPKNR